jgi:NAD(P)-dependent dehydrogenase (short-subunit alcohol dehydrogenase family)
MSLIYNKDDIFIVSGATSGIGYAVCYELCQAGASVVALGRNSEKFKDFRYPNLHFRELDLSIEPSEITKIIKDLAGEFGCFKGAVLAAGFQFISPFGMTKFQKIKELFDVNLFGNLAIAQAFNHKKVHSQTSSSLVFLSSISSIRGNPGILSYAATKGAINSSVKTMALEYASKKVRVNAILPGLVRTELVDKHSNVYTAEYLEEIDSSYPLGIGNVQDVVKPILFLLSDDASWITGTEIIVDGGASI